LEESAYDSEKMEYLVSGFRDGFRLRLDRPVGAIATAQYWERAKGVRNHQSALDHPRIVEEKLTKEIRAGRMLGPFPAPVFPRYCVSPLGLTKKKEPGKFRVIHDLSFPRGGGLVNDCIPKEAGSVSYDTVDTAVRLIQKLGPGAVMYKSDVEHAYKLIPIHPEDIPALGVNWFEDWLWDGTLPMGSRSGCSIFEAFSTALQHIAEFHGCGPMCHVLDDFLLLDLTSLGADDKMGAFLDICKELGVPMVVAKTEKGVCLRSMSKKLVSLLNSQSEKEVGVMVLV
jgi:hypothetical protein